MARRTAVLLAILLDCNLAVRETVDALSEEVRRLRPGHTFTRQRRRGDEDDDEDEDEDEEGDANNDDDGHKEMLVTPGKMHGEAKYIYKPATDGFRELDKVVESIDAAADDASSKAKRVDTDYATYRGRMHDTGEMLDRLSLSGQQFQKEVVDYFADAETDRFSPLAVRVPYRDFIPDLKAVEKLRVAEAKEFTCRDVASFCCTKGMVWTDVRQRTAASCVAAKGDACPKGHMEHPAVARLSDTKDRKDKEDKGDCVPKDAAHYFRKSSDWEDESRLEQSDLLGDLASLPQAENILAEKLSAANTPKHALVQSVCARKQWVELLDALDAKLCDALKLKDQGSQGKAKSEGENEDEEKDRKEPSGEKEDEEKEKKEPSEEKEDEEKEKKEPSGEKDDEEKEKKEKSGEKEDEEKEKKESSGEKEDEEKEKEESSGEKEDEEKEKEESSGEKKDEEKEKTESSGEKEDEEKEKKESSGEKEDEEKDKKESSGEKEEEEKDKKESSGEKEDEEKDKDKS